MLHLNSFKFEVKQRHPMKAKSTRISLALSVVVALFVTSCRKECPIDKEGADCELNIIDKFIGLWQGNGTCSGGNSVIVSSEGGNRVSLTGLTSSQIYSVVGTAEFTSILFDSNQPIADGVTLVSASAVVLPNGSLRVSFNYQDESSGSPVLKTCSFIGELQTANASIILPSVITSPVSSRPDTLPNGNWAGFASSGGNVTTNGGTEILKRGVCWGTQPNPTVSSDNKTENGGGPGAFNSVIFGLSQGQLYFVRAYATNQFGTAYGETVQFKRDCQGDLCVGDSHLGGIIIALTSPNSGTLIYPSNLQSAEWGCLGISIGTSDNNGASNTDLIVDQCPELGIAARLCADLGDGWFLPSLSEINQPMVRAYLNNSQRYWTSSQKDAGTAWSWNEQSGTSETLSKDESAAVRPLKQF